MTFKNLLKEWSRVLWQGELEQLDTLRASQQQYEDGAVYKEELEKELLSVNNLLLKTKGDLLNYVELFLNNEKPNYKDWRVHNPNYKTIDGLNVMPNTFITPNDRDLRQVLINKGFHNMDFETMVWKLEQWVFDYIKYVNDNSVVGDDWRSASYTFKNRKGDCDNKSILFQTCMHILGHGDKSVVIANTVDLGGFKGGHAYNKVLINGEWIIVDPTNPKKFRKESWKYDIIHSQLNFFFNYWGCYKVKDENNVLK